MNKASRSDIHSNSNELCTLHVHRNTFGQVKQRQPGGIINKLGTALLYVVLWDSWPHVVNHRRPQFITLAGPKPAYTTQQLSVRTYAYIIEQVYLLKRRVLLFFFCKLVSLAKDSNLLKLDTCLLSWISRQAVNAVLYDVKYCLPVAAGQKSSISCCHLSLATSGSRSVLIKVVNIFKYYIGLVYCFFVWLIF